MVSSVDELVERLLEAELRVANKYLPVERRSLRELLSEPLPRVLCRDGSLHFFRKSELLELRKYLEESELDRLRLPIIIQVKVEFDTLTSIIEGEVEVKVTKKILGLIHEGDRLYLYRPQIMELRYKYPTVYQIALI